MRIYFLSFCFLVGLLVSCKSDIADKQFDLSTFDRDYLELLQNSQIDTLTYYRGLLLKKDRFLERLNNRPYKEVVKVLDTFIKERGSYEDQYFENDTLRVSGLKTLLGNDSLKFEYKIDFKESFDIAILDTVQLGVHYANMVCESVYWELYTNYTPAEFDSPSVVHTSKHNISDFYEFDELRFDPDVAARIPPSIIAKYAFFDMAVVYLMFKDGNKKIIVSNRN